MDNISCNKTDDGIQIYRNNSLIYTLPKEINKYYEDFNFEQNCWYINTDYGEYLIYNDVGNSCFYDIIIVNLKNNTTIRLDDLQYKFGARKILYTQKSNSFILFGYPGGQGAAYDHYDFEGNRIEDFYNFDYDGNEKECIYDFSHNENNGVMLENGEIILNYVIPKSYFQDKYKKYIDFDMSLLIEKGDNYILNVCKYLPIYDPINTKEDIEKIKIFKNTIIRRGYIEKCWEEFDKNNKNIFKEFLSKEIDYVVINKDKSYYENYNRIFDLTIDQIKDIKHNGFYSGNDFFGLCTRNFFSYNYSNDTFGKFLIEQTLGCQYNQNGYINKELLPDGIGLIFKIETDDNIVFEFIIKMSLKELENDNSKITFDKEKSKININVNIY
jgi:hypothetical protein